MTSCRLPGRVETRGAGGGLEEDGAELEETGRRVKLDVETRREVLRPSQRRRCNVTSDTASARRVHVSLTGRPVCDNNYVW